MKKRLFLVPGDHGTTYGGNPLATAAINKVLDLFEETDVLENVCEVGKYLESKLDEICDKFACAKEHRGKGLMQGLVLDVPVGEVINKAMDKGLLVISAGGNVLRMVPPLIITKENVDEMINILTDVLSTF